MLCALSPPCHRVQARERCQEGSTKASTATEGRDDSDWHVVDLGGPHTPVCVHALLLLFHMQGHRREHQPALCSLLIDRQAWCPTAQPLTSGVAQATLLPMYS